jgi:hypothetical protein
MRSKREHEDPEATQIVIKRRLESVQGAEGGDSVPRRDSAVRGDSVPRSDSAPRSESASREAILPTARRRQLVLYSAGLALAGSLGLAALVSYAWYLEPGGSLTAMSASLQRYALIHTLLTMLVAGIAGGALSNLREFLRLGRRQDGVPVRLEVSLYLRPLSGGVMGLLVFFLLQFFIAVLSVGGTTQGWALLHGRLAYVAVALVVGFAVRDLESLRDVVASLVARRD